MNFDLTLGEAIQILIQVGVAVAIIATLRGDIRRLTELFRQHEEYDRERFDNLRNDIQNRNRYFGGN